MKEILITDEIGGWGISANEIRNQLNAIPEGEDVRITIDSPGGDFFEMVPIFNMIRDFARTHSQKVETYIQGMAASAASMIALAAKAGNPENKIIVEDNSIYMIHNCWTVEMGDHRVMEETARTIARIDELQRDIYSRRTGKDRKELTKIMDAGNFMYGAEIVEGGFADEVISSNNDDSTDMNAFASAKDSKIISAKLAFDSMQNKMRAEAKAHSEFHSKAKDMAFACLADKPQEQTTYVSSEKTIQPEASGVTEDSIMNQEELKAKYPELYAAVYNEGMNAERTRVQSHLKMATDSGDINAAVEFINSGVNCADNTCVAKYHEVFTKNALAKARMADTVPNTMTPPTADEGAKAALDAFAKETGLKG